MIADQQLNCYHQIIIHDKNRAVVLCQWTDVVKAKTLSNRKGGHLLSPCSLPTRPLSWYKADMPNLEWEKEVKKRKMTIIIRR